MNHKNHSSDKGYKQTEVGVIPEDWEVTKLAGICSMKSGEGITNANIDQFSKYPCYGGNGLRGFTTRFTHDGRYALIGRQGALCGNVLDVKGKFFASEHAIVVTASARTDMRWLTFVLGDLQLNQYSESSAQPGLSVSKILSLEVALPPTQTEQNAIATALSDADALITSLEKLIAKKRSVKQGAMQKCLNRDSYDLDDDYDLKNQGNHTNHKNHSSDKWVVKRLGDYLDYEQPTNYIVIDTEYNDNNQTPVLTAGKTFILGYTHEEFGIFKNVPVIIFDDFTTATKYVDFPFKVKSSAMKILKPKSEEVHLRFVYEVMQRMNYPMGIGDHKRHWIGEYQHLEIKVPSPVEQTRIAAILSDMDAEIEALEKKLDKYRQIKQGMMQELLTGKTRLIEATPPSP